MEAHRIAHGRRPDAGFALILAILALMLLTFLGLTLAVTTSTELQIATNYRWSRQALYNAEAGLEAAKLILSNTPQWKNLLPGARTWAPGATPGPPLWTQSGRDFENMKCDTLGGQGYGVVLANASAPGGPAQRWENISAPPAANFMNQPLNGGFTLWVRRPICPSPDCVNPPTNPPGDDASTPPANLVLTVEGVAPYIGASNTNAFTAANQARQLLEINLTLNVGGTCKQMGGQRGAAPTGENFDPCSALSAGATGSLAGAFGNAAGRVGSVGDLASTGAK